MMSKYETCPKCKHSMVYEEHDESGYAVGCSFCGFGTERYATRREAHAEWDKMVEQINGK